VAGIKVPVENAGTGYHKKNRKIWGVPYMVLPKNGWFIIGNPIFKWMTGGTPYFRKPPFLVVPFYI
jgi:hypothetical protein